MKVIKQLSEDEFVIKLDNYDLKTEKRIVIAHDYVQFSGNSGLEIDSSAGFQPKGKFATCANWIKGYFNVQINIRSFIKVILPHLLESEYCQESHLVDEKGNPLYNWDSRPIIFHKENKDVIAFKMKDGNYTIIPYEAYTQIKDMIKKEEKE